MQNEKGYSRRAIESSPKLSRVLGQIAAGVFSGGDNHRYSDILHNLYEHDYFLVSSDFDDYFATQREVDVAYRNVPTWTRMAAANTAGMGWFSSDRTIRGYAEDIWGAKSID